MSDLNVLALRASLEQALQERGVLMDRLFNNLLNDYPNLRDLFVATDMEKQKRDFARALCFVVNNIENEARLVAFLNTLGATHSALGVGEKQFKWLKAALISSLMQTIPDLWSEELGLEWYKLVDLITTHMLANDGGVQPGAVTVTAPADHEKSPDDGRDDPSALEPQDAANFGDGFADDADDDEPLEELAADDSLATDPVIEPELEPELEPEPEPEAEPIGLAAATSAPASDIPTDPSDAALKLVTDGLRQAVPTGIDLPDNLRHKIRSIVADALQEAVEREVQAALAEELEGLTSERIDRLIKKVI